MQKGMKLKIPAFKMKMIVSINFLDVEY